MHANPWRSCLGEPSTKLASSPLQEGELLHYSDKGEKEEKALASLHKVPFIINKFLHKLKGNTIYGVKTPPKVPVLVPEVLEGA